MSGFTPTPPGTQITSSGGVSAKVVSGSRTRPVTETMGARSFQIRRTFAPGMEANIS